MRAKIRILEATVMKVVRYGFETLGTLKQRMRKIKDAKYFQTMGLRIVLGTPFPDPNNKPYRNGNSTKLSRAIMNKYQDGFAHFC